VTGERDVENVDFQLELERAFRVSGRLTGPDIAIAHQLVRLVPTGMEELGNGGEAATTRSTEDGAFTFVKVTPGEYTLDVRGMVSQFEQRIPSGLGSVELPRPPGLGGAPQRLTVQAAEPEVMIATYMPTSPDRLRHWARKSVTVSDSDLVGISVPVRPTATLSGVVVLERGAPALAAGVILIAEPAATTAALGLPQNYPDPQVIDRFEISGVLPGEYFLRLGGSQVVKAVMWNGRNFVDTPLPVATSDVSGIEVTVAATAGAIAGRVTWPAGASTTTAVVVVFPREPARWISYGLTSRRLRMADVSSDGTYHCSGLPSGDYYAVALEAGTRSDWLSYKFLEKVAPLAVSVSVPWGATVSVHLPVVASK
jgi:hypothetical protein